MPSTSIHSTYPFAGHTVRRLGYGAMRLSGPNIFGPPKDHDAALAVLRAAVAAGVDHIDTSDFYGPHVTNRIIREALHPYPIRSSSSRRSAPSAAATLHGCRHKRRTTSAGPWTITCATWVSTCSTS